MAGYNLILSLGLSFTYDCHIRAEEHKGIGMKKKKVEQAELPGDLSRSDLVERFIRVNHAGEFGAKRIYEGQLAVLKNNKDAAVIEHMKDQELHHLETFEKLIVERKVRLLCYTHCGM